MKPAGRTVCRRTAALGKSERSSSSAFCVPYPRKANPSFPQEGQTAGDLQIRYNLSYHTLTAANEGKDLENLRGGDIVGVPEENVPCPVPQTVVLGEGETLSTLADRYGKTTAALLRANFCLAPRDFRAGAAVRLPE